MAATGTLRSETPASPAEAAALLRACADEGAGVRIAGGATKLGWGRPPADCAVMLQTTALDAITEHNHGDLTAVVQAGITLSALDDVVSAAGQMLALDPPLGAGYAATLGGALATGDSGPLRHRFGGPRDLVLGVTLALSDGTLAHAGGKVIKNVAGYDLAKLFTGAYGTLGLIVEVAVRLQPRPPAVATATGSTDDAATLQAAAIALANSTLEAQALDVRWEDGVGTVLARFAGVAAGEQAGSAQALLQRCGLQSAITEADGRLWERQRAAQRAGDPDGAVVRVSGQPTGLAAACGAAAQAGGTLVGRAALGVWWIALPAGRDLCGAITALRAALTPFPCIVLDAPAAVRTALDPWDQPDDGGLVLMRRVKARFDPTATCNPGIFVGGI